MAQKGRSFNPIKGKQKLDVSHRLVEEGNEKRVGIYRCRNCPLEVCSAYSRYFQETMETVAETGVDPCSSMAGHMDIELTREF